MRGIGSLITEAEPVKVRPPRTENQSPTLPSIRPSPPCVEQPYNR
jgi:hypothetical protein